MERSAPPRPDLLITGFGPFPGVPINPSARLAGALARALRRTGWPLRHAVLPVAYGPMQQVMAPLMAENPRAILLFGIAARRRAVSVEMLARNRASRSLRDAAGRRPASARLDSGPAVMRGRAPMARLVELMREAGLPARLSRDAGPYLCNAAYRFALGGARPETRIVFVHIPRVKQGQDRRGLPFAPLLAGSARLARRLVLAARLSGR